MFVLDLREMDSVFIGFYEYSLYYFVYGVLYVIDWWCHYWCIVVSICECMCESTAVITEEEREAWRGNFFFCAVSFLRKSVTIATLEAEAEREGEGVNWGSARDLVTIATHKGNGRNLQKYMRCYRLGGRGREKREQTRWERSQGGTRAKWTEQSTSANQRPTLVTIAQSESRWNTKHLSCTRLRTVVKHDTRRMNVHGILQKQQCSPKMNEVVIQNVLTSHAHALI